MISTTGGGAVKRADVQREKAAPASGFRPEQLIVTTLDPRTNVLYEIENYDHEGLWTIVSRRAAEIAVANQAGQADTTVSPAMSGVRRAAHGASSSASKRPRTGFVAASMAHADKSSSAPSPPSYEDTTVERAVKEVDAFKQMLPSPMAEEVN